MAVEVDCRLHFSTFPFIGAICVFRGSRFRQNEPNYQNYFVHFVNSVRPAFVSARGWIPSSLVIRASSFSKSVPSVPSVVKNKDRFGEGAEPSTRGGCAPPKKAKIVVDLFCK
jgi:hypothetical protein